jgi:hypothetical protein
MVPQHREDARNRSYPYPKCGEPRLIDLFDSGTLRKPAERDPALGALRHAAGDSRRIRFRNLEQPSKVSSRLALGNCIAGSLSVLTDGIVPY